jgi:hypothetical protein
MKKEKKNLSIEDVSAKKQRKKEIGRGALIVVASMLVFCFVVGASVNGIFAASKYLSKISAANSVGAGNGAVQSVPQATPEATQQATPQAAQQTNVVQSGNQGTNTQSGGFDNISAEEKKKMLLDIQYEIKMIALEAQRLKIGIDAYEQFDGWSDAFDQLDATEVENKILSYSGDVYRSIDGREFKTFLLSYDQIPFYDGTTSDITHARQVYRFAEQLTHRYDTMCDTYGVEFDNPFEG